MTDVRTRATRVARGTDLGWVAALLAERRGEILDRWLDVATAVTLPIGTGSALTPAERTA